MSTPKINALRQSMQKAHVAALIVPGTDPHCSEYLTNHWKERAYISEFTGSAGSAVITLEGGGLWTDSRYFLQAETQLKPSGLQLFKLGLSTTPSIAQYLISTLKEGDAVALNPLMFSIKSFQALKEQLHQAHISIQIQHDFIDEVWKDRPALPQAKAMELDLKFSGEPVKEKLMRVREHMTSHGANVMLLTALDDIAWLFNIRGNDIAYNPVVIAYAVIEKDRAILFSAQEKFPKTLLDSLALASVILRPYEEILPYLEQLEAGKTIALDFKICNAALHQALPSTLDIIDIPSPVQTFKGVKNATEIAGFRHAHQRDGVALCNFFYWLEHSLEQEELTEISISDKLREFRAEQNFFVSESFETIAGFGPHGAIVHYSARPNTVATLQKGDFILIDSGAQYLDGTTDITRTIALGKVDDQHRHDYTLVLKGHLALGKAVFPKGTRGTQLDVLARQFLWNELLQYGHGTGHGVGHFLNVHEGPHSIRMEENPVCLEPGMVVSNEPGLYRTNHYGIRIENLLLVTEAGSNEFGQFHEFDTLTLFPYDIEAMDINMLTLRERAYINIYHQKVYQMLKDDLKPEVKAWLKHKTREI